ncbi:MAG: TAXI family TRAP transporter solute-binding subunit [Thermoleophilaceae bacterium]
MPVALGRRFAASAILVLVVLGGGCGGEQSASDREGGNLSVATGGTGGVYSVYGGGLADVISEELEGYKATAETTSASVDNMKLIAQKDSDVAFTLADTAIDAVEGRESFDEPLPVRALAQIYTNYTQVGTTAGKGISSIEDLRGKRVSVGDPGSGTEVIALRVLEAAGLDPEEDIDRSQLGVDESVNAVRDGSIDAFFWSGGLPTGSVTDLATTDELVLVPNAEYVSKLRDQYGEAYQETTIPADTYKGLEEDVPVIGVPNLLVVHEGMDEDLAHDLTALLFDQKKRLTQVHPEAENLDRAEAQDVVPPVKLHPGAQRYFEEGGS